MCRWLATLLVACAIAIATASLAHAQHTGGSFGGGHWHVPAYHPHAPAYHPRGPRPAGLRSLPGRQRAGRAEISVLMTPWLMFISVVIGAGAGRGAVAIANALAARAMQSRD